MSESVEPIAHVTPAPIFTAARVTACAASAIAVMIFYSLFAAPIVQASAAYDRALKDGDLSAECAAAQQAVVAWDNVPFFGPKDDWRHRATFDCLRASTERLRATY